MKSLKYIAISIAFSLILIYVVLLWAESNISYSFGLKYIDFSKITSGSVDVDVSLKISNNNLFGFKLRDMLIEISKNDTIILRSRERSDLDIFSMLKTELVLPFTAFGNQEFFKVLENYKLNKPSSVDYKISGKFYFIPFSINSTTEI